MSYNPAKRELEAVMARIVYIKARNSALNAHQYVIFDGERLGEIWREQVHISNNKGQNSKKWRWFAKAHRSLIDPCSSSMLFGETGHGTKDKAVDTIEALLCRREASPAINDDGEAINGFRKEKQQKTL
ncbi:hypothetical protein [Noviherbaspirillum malthae]|uniref:hypothetical protein n=1 Tax=Noviherbaspirillum malthae TaxID=1260987 RepID=UPI00188F344F|nr:hypothetical protein [Noviherbaspirillum malthae]